MSAPAQMPVSRLSSPETTPSAPARSRACAPLHKNKKAPQHAGPADTFPPSGAASLFPGSSRHPPMPQRRSRKAKHGGRRTCPDLSGDYLPRRGTGQSPAAPICPLPFYPSGAKPRCLSCLFFLLPDSRGGPAGGDFFGVGGEDGEFGFGEEACEAAARAPAGAYEG